MHDSLIFHHLLRSRAVLLAAWLLLAGMCAGADFYVDPDRADDTGDGTTPATAERTIAAAIVDASSGDTIYLCDDTDSDGYGDDVQTWTQDMPNKTLTFKPYLVDYVTLTRTAEGSSGMFRVNSADYGAYTYTFEDIRFVDAKASGVVFFFYDVDAAGSVIFRRCTFTPSSTGVVVFATQATVGGNYIRRATLTDCTATLTNTATSAFYINSFSQFLVDDCVFTNSGTSVTLPMFQINYLCGPHRIANTAITCEYGITVPSFERMRADFILENCTLTNPDTALSGGYMTSGGYGLVLDNSVNATTETVKGVRLLDNTFIGYPDAVLNYASNSVFYGNNVYGGANGFLFYGGIKNQIICNRISATYSRSASNGRNLVVGRKLYLGGSGFVSKRNTFDATTVVPSALSLNGVEITNPAGTTIRVTVANTYATGDTVTLANTASNDGTWTLTAAAATYFEYTDATPNAETCGADDTATQALDLADVGADGTFLAIASTTKTGSDVATAFGVVNTVNDTTDTVTVDRWIITPFGTPAVDADGPDDNTYYVSFVRFPDFTIVVNNIFDKGGAIDGITYDFNPQSNMIFDYNLYSEIKTNLANTLTTTLAAQLTIWQTWPTAGEVTYYNDQHSVVRSPGTNTTIISGGVVFGLPSTSTGGGSGGMLMGSGGGLLN